MTNTDYLKQFTFTGQDSKAVESINFNQYDIDADCKWEKRFFWPPGIPIQIHGLNPSNYEADKLKIKQHNDCYILKPQSKQNIKLRKDLFTYKPLLKTENETYGYGKKQKYAMDDNSEAFSALLPALHSVTDPAVILHVLNDQYLVIPVIKDVCAVKLNKDLKAQCEFSKVKIDGQIFYSFGIEAKNKQLVQDLAKLIVPEIQATEYIQFIKSLSQ